MGCDIHVYVERKVDDSWVMEHVAEGAFGQRNYALFNALCGVRGPGPAEPLGIPEDVSSSVQMVIDDWDCDGHSHSYMLLKEAMATWRLINAHDMPDKQDLYYYLFHIDEAYVTGEVGYPKREYRVVFFFDN